MYTFLIGLVLLIVGGFFYGQFCQKVFRPDDRRTPALTRTDGVDYLPMKSWKNSLIELLNIAGTGPILGPIQGILFGPIAFLTIPIGCVLGGAVHDFLCGMISARCGGCQTQEMVGRFLGKISKIFYTVFVCILLLLVGAVFIYTPGDILAEGILGTSTSASNWVIWVIYGVIFLYYLAATLFPIDKIIGKIYPVFGAVLLLSAVGVFIGLFTSGYSAALTEIWSPDAFTLYDGYFGSNHFLPIFFVTVACGIVSGFHATQASLVSRTIQHERQGRTVFYWMMIAEGVIAMIWAAAAMGAYSTGVSSTSDGAQSVLIAIARDLLGNVGGIIAMVGVIVLPITSGDTALRSMRLLLAETFGIDQVKKKNRLLLSAAIFAVVAGILVFAKLSADGFQILWRYFSWANQVIAVFGFAYATVYLILRHSRAFAMTLIPGMFYFFVVSSYILNASIGFRLSWTVSYIAAGVLTALYGFAVPFAGFRKRGRVAPEDPPVYEEPAPEAVQPVT